MFEKEADLAETEMLIHCHGDYSKKKNYREGWQEGATFGYNKGNEWHYVKDGVFPEECEIVVCYCRGYCGVSSCATARLYIGYDKVRRWWTTGGEGKSEQLTDVIAWKEIELPNI